MLFILLQVVVMIWHIYGNIIVPPPPLLLPPPSRRPRLFAIVDHHPPDVLCLEVINDRPVPPLVQRQRVIVVPVADAIVIVVTVFIIPRAARGPP